MAEFVVVGEALLDVAPEGPGAWLARPGGSPYNVAVGLARLGQVARFAGRLSADPLGSVLRTHALESGVDLSLCAPAREPTTVALVSLVDGVAEYQIGVDGTADFAWTADELSRLPAAAGVHFGSLASWLPPGCGLIADRLAALRQEGALVSYDPNVRPALFADVEVARTRVEASVRIADVVKASADDLAWLYPGRPVADVASAWLGLGAALVVVTLGGDGSSGWTQGEAVQRASRPVKVVDTVGAGDAFMSGLLDGLASRSLVSRAAVLGISAEVLGAVLDHAGLVAAVTCTRAGADPPTRDELGSSGVAFRDGTDEE